MGVSSSMLMNSMRERFLAMTRSVSLRSLMVEGRCFLRLSEAIRDNVASSSLEEDFLMVEMEGRTGTGTKNFSVQWMSVDFINLDTKHACLFLILRAFLSVCTTPLLSATLYVILTSSLHSSPL